MKRPANLILIIFNLKKPGLCAFNSGQEPFFSSSSLLTHGKIPIMTGCDAFRKNFSCSKGRLKNHLHFGKARTGQKLPNEHVISECFSEHFLCICVTWAHCFSLLFVDDECWRKAILNTYIIGTWFIKNMEKKICRINSYWQQFFNPWFSAALWIELERCAIADSHR